MSMVAVGMVGEGGQAGLDEGGGNDSGARGWQRRRIWSSATSGAPSCSRALLRSPIPPHYRTSAVGTRRRLEEAREKDGERQAQPLRRKQVERPELCLLEERKY